MMNKFQGAIIREKHGHVQALNYKDRPPNLRSILAQSAKTYPDKNAFECYSATVTYAEFAGDVERLGAAMQNDLGVEKGDRVALLLGNDIAFPLVFFATAAIGAVSVPIHTRLVATEIEFILDNSGARVIFVDPERLAESSRATRSAKELKHTVLTGPRADAPDCLRLDTLLNESSGELESVQVEEIDLASIFYTSGTTGKPKGAMCSHRNYISNAMNTRAAVGATPKDRGLICVPLCHPTACHSQMVSGVYLGSTSVILRRFNADETLRTIGKEKITTLVGVPTIYWLLLAQIKLIDYDLASLTNIIYGGATSSPELVRSLREAFPSVRLGNGYGLTESSSLATFLPDEYTMDRPDSVGPPVPTVELRIVDDSGRGLAPGKIGEILLKGPNIVDGYWRDAAATRDAFSDGWLRTGDLGRVDEEGFLYVVDRKKDMIIRGGENIYCVEIENILESHPGVFEAAVVGRSDRVFGEQVMAYIARSPNSNVTMDDILDFCDERLADFKVPKYLEFIDELPRNPAGKVDKRTLRD